MVVEKPVFGQGPGTFYSKLGQYYRPGNEGWMPRYENAHNYFVQVAAETGILGLAGFLWCVGTLMVSGFTRALITERHRTRLLAIGAGAYLFTALAQHPLVLSEQAFLFWGYLGILGACMRLNQAPPAASPLLYSAHDSPYRLGAAAKRNSRFCCCTRSRDGHLRPDIRSFTSKPSKSPHGGLAT